MLHVRRGFGDEKAQLNELNKRLDQYLSRVRQLEGENQVLVDEIHRLRQERGAEWTENYYDELCQLRRKVEELSVQKCEAELQKDNLWQEIQDLQGLWEQVRSMRLRIDKQLELYKQDLQQAKSNQAALEELYFRLQQECQILQTSQKEELFALRDQALQMPLQITMQEVVRPRLSLMDVQSLALELSESWKEAFLVYQKKIQELENTLRLDEVHCLGVDEEVRIQKLHIKELRREYEELLGIQKTLEKELLRMKDKYRLEVEEYQIIIEELEIERQTITITITDRLKDYHDLMQVKTGLNLEVAAYRALLEAESKKGTVIWTESSMRNRPAGYVTSAFEKSTNYSNRGIKYPITGHKEEIRRNMETTNIDRFLTRTLPQPQIRSKYSQLGNTSSSYVSHVYENTTQDKSGRWDTSFPSRYDISNKTFPQTMYRLEQPTVATPFLPTQSTLINETTKEQTVKDLKPVARPRTHSKEAKKVDVHIRTEDRKQDTISQRTLETKVTEEMRATSQPVEEIQQTLEINLHNIEKDNTISEEAASVAKSVTKDMIQEPKPQELPVKKERKKREQAKKRKGELEKVDIGEMDVAEESRAEVHDTTHVTKTVALGEKESEGAENQQIVLEIPIELKARKTENITQKRYMEDKAQQNFSYMNVNDKSMFLGNVDSLKAHKTNITEDSDVTTISGQREKGTLHDDIFRHLGHSSVIDESETNVISVEKKQQDSGSGTTIFGESMQREQVVLDIPIRYEGRKREVSSEIENVEHSEHSRLSGNFKQTNVSEEAFLKNQEAINANENYEDNAKCTVESEVADSSSEPNGKKAMVADILRQLGQPTALDDSNVIYVEREEQCSDGFVKTQIFVQSKTEEEFDLFDEPDLTDLWNTTIIQSPTETVPGSIGSQSEETGSRTTKKTILKDVTGAQAEEWIGNVIHSGLKTGTGKSINVEIVEESFETFGYEKGDFSTPFHVEEAEDNFNIEESVITEQHSSMPTKKLQDETQLRKGPSQVEEVKEGEHVDEETDYFVYVPDDIPCLEEEEEEEETLRGQIHTEEESHVKYSWQDEFLQGSQGRKSLSDLLKNAMTTEQSSASEYTSDENIKRLVNAEKEQSHTESIVIERKIEVPQEMKSSIMNLLSKDNKNPQETLKGALDCLQGKLPQDLVDELSTLAEEEQTQNSSLTVDIKKVGQTEEKGMVTIVAEINVSQTVDTDNMDMLELVKDVQSEVTAIHKSNIKSDDITSFLHTQNENVTFAKESDKYQESYHSVTMGTDNGAKHYITEEISVKGQTNPSILYSPTRELSIGQISTDVNKFIKHIELSTQENVTCEETGTEQGSAGELSPTEINRSEHHFTIGPREMLSKKQIIFEGPISETLKLDIVKNTEDYSDQNRSIRHIKISPTENYPTEKIIFHGSIFKTSGTGGNVTGGLSVKDNYANNVSQIDQTLVYRENQSGDQEKIIQGNDYIAGTSNTISHFKINSGEMSKEILLEGSIPRPNDLSRHITLDPEDKGAPIEFNFATQKVHVAKQIKYQGYVSEPQSTENTGSFVQSKDQSNINTSVHHIKLSPSREQIVFEGPMLPNFQFREADGAHMENKNRSISHIQLGSPDSHTSECITFEGPTRETYESSEYIVSSPSGDSSESERSIKHIKLGPTEKSFIFQMDITKIATQHTGEERTQESSMVITSSKTEGQQKSSQSYNELKDDSEVAESGYGMEEMAGISQFPYNITSHQYIGDMSEVEKTVQLQRIVQQSHMVSDDKKVAVVFLDDGDDEEEPDQDYLRRSF
ncbi:synemin [Rhinoderma darwinii]|uniref:synemin n=1 Tax=Rhinoderma darwinii TaxID=43563 RepID=UPI003F6670F2